MNDRIKTIQNQIFEKKGTEPSSVTGIFDVIKEFGCLGDILGREFEVYDCQDNLKYTVKQKPLNTAQISVLVNELKILRLLEKEATEKKGKVNKSRK